MRLASSLAAARVLRRSSAKVLRIGVHPPDVRHPSLVRSIERALEGTAQSRLPGRYFELLTKD
jgi:hypothetical protein